MSDVIYIYFSVVAPHASSQSNLASGEANYLSNGTETRLKRTTAATPLQHFRQIEKPDKKETKILKLPLNFAFTGKIQQSLKCEC